MKLSDRTIGFSTLLTLMLASLLAVSPAFAKDKEAKKDDAPFKLYIRDAQALEGGGVEIFGRITDGSISVGDTVCVPLTGDRTEAREVAAIVEFSRKLETATTGKSIHVAVHDVADEDVKMNDYLTTGCEAES